MPHPVVFAAPADIELLPAPIPTGWILEGRPEAKSRRLGTSADGTASIMAWSCTPGRFTWHYNVDEVIHIISGEIIVTDEKGQSAISMEDYAVAMVDEIEKPQFLNRRFTVGY